jgi:glycosyltransferase involved in cell wall biosynthesis
VRSASASRRAIILTSYRTGAARGKNLGVPGYSYDLVAQLFAPLLARWGEVIPAARDAAAVESAVQDARRRGLDPVHVSFVACQDMVFASSAPNVIVPAWEFPDVPNEAFEGNPQNNWVTTANRCDLVLVGGQFSVDSFQRAGIRTPIRIVPVPTPPEYFDVPPWSPHTVTRLACSAYVFPNPNVPAHELWDAPDSPSSPLAGGRGVGGEGELPRRPSLRRSLVGQMRLVYRHILKPLIPPIVHRMMRNCVRPVGTDRWQDYLRSCRREELELSGVVYTSIFSPRDARKNHEDLLSGFLAALRDCADATLVVKLVAADSLWIDGALNYYRTAGLSHRCKVVFIVDYLSGEQMLALARASAYYLTTTRAEGNCLPLMNYLAAGRPGVTPCHTAIGDYFSPDMGFVIASATERALWPQDKRIRFKTTWNRIEWPSVIEQLRNSYHLALRDRPAYDALAATGRQRMAQWVESEAVWPRLRDALDSLGTRQPCAEQAA